MKKIITSTLGMMLLLASCGTDPSTTAVNLENLPAIKTQPEQQFKAASLGNAAKGDWVGKWTSVATGRTLYNFANIGIQGGIQNGTNIKYAFAHDNNVMIRSGTFGNTLTTAYLVRVPNASKDHFEGWYANYNCEAGCKGTIAYFEMKRDIKSTSIDATNWYGRFDPKPLDTLVGGNFLLKTKVGIPAPGGTQDGTNIDYRIGNGTIRRSGTYSNNGRTFGTTAEMLEVPGTGHYIGWYANSDSSKLGFFVAANRTPVAGGTQWSMLHETANAVPSGGGTWTTEANGFVKNTSVQYTINSDKDLFRSGAPAHLLHSNNGTETYMGWYTGNGALNYFDASRGAFKGVSLAGLEFSVDKTTADPGALPGTLGTHYYEPTQAEVETYLSKGLRSFRIPFRWERLQRETLVGPTNGTAQLDPAYFNLIDKQVKAGTDRGATVILDMHNYARYLRYNSDNTINATGSSITSNDFKQVWGELARRYASNPRVVFGLMNEPFSTNSQWIYDAQEAAIQEIRKYAANMILISGNEFSGTWSWTTNLYNAAGNLQPKNADLFNTLAKRYANVVIETHQYFDKKGQYERFQGVGNCVKEKLSTDVGNNAIFTPTSNTTEFVQSLFEKTTKNLRDNGLKGYLGEFGLFDSTECAGILDATLKYLDDNSDVWIGWAYWAGGPKWGQLQKGTSNYLESNGVFLPGDTRLNSLSTYAQK
jgi:endoglucanase